MMQFFYGCTEAISRISLPQKAGSRQAKDNIREVHAWDQPDQHLYVYPMPHHSYDQASS